MPDFPEFIRNPKNRIARTSQFTDDIEGYVFDGAGGSQVALWTCKADRVSKEHAHAFDEYVVVLEGGVTAILDGRRVALAAGEELHVPRGTRQSMEVVAGTRTMHVFGGRRAEREAAPRRAAAPSAHWTETFFDEDYARLWSFPGAKATAEEIAGLRTLIPPPPAKVLDVSCGNGRHAIALAALGFEVTGLDSAAPFLELARRFAAEANVTVEFRQGDVRGMDLEGFDVVVMLGNSFGYHEDAENREVLARVARATRPGGLVIVDLLNRDRIVANYKPHGGHSGADGTALSLESTLDPITGVNEVVHRWSDASGAHERRSRQRLYTPAELAGMCAAARLEPIGWFDGLSVGRRPFELAAHRLVVVARRLEA